MHASYWYPQTQPINDYRYCFSISGKKLTSPYPVSNHEVGYLLSGPWGRVMSAAQERSWSDALPDTTNDPDRF